MARIAYDPNAKAPEITGEAARMAAEKPWLMIPPGWRIAPRDIADHFRASNDPERYKIRLERDFR